MVALKKLVARSEENIKYFIPAEELYDVLDKAYRDVGDGGGNIIGCHAYVTKQIIILYLFSTFNISIKEDKEKRDLANFTFWNERPNGSHDFHLNEIFLTVCILQSDNWKEFVNGSIWGMTRHWAELKLLPGKRRHSQNQGSVETAKQDLENMAEI